MKEPKRPYLFYYEEALDHWIPAPSDIREIICLDDLYTDYERTIEFKTIDMTRTEFETLEE